MDNIEDFEEEDDLELDVQEVVTFIIMKAFEWAFLQVFSNENTVVFERIIHGRKFKISVVNLNENLIVSLREEYPQPNMWLNTVYNFETMIDTTTSNQEGEITTQQEDFDEELFQIDLDNFVRGQTLLHLELKAMEFEGR